MNNQTLGFFMIAAAGAWIWYQNQKLKPAVPTVTPNEVPGTLPAADAIPAVITPIIPAQGNPITSRVEAVWYAEQLISWLEATDNKPGAEAIRTAITSFYTPKA
jgi:hypothetical protein